MAEVVARRSRGKLVAFLAVETRDEAAADDRLAQYQPYWAARAELLARTHAYDQARGAYDIAIGLERDASVRCFLRQRQAALPA